MAVADVGPENGEGEHPSQMIRCYVLSDPGLRSAVSPDDAAQSSDVVPSPFLGLHRLRPIHAHLVCKYARGDAIFHHPKHRVRWALSMLLVIGRFFITFGILLLRSIKKEPHRPLHRRWMDSLHADLDMYIIVLPALHGTRCACEHLGCGFAPSPSALPRFRLSASCGHDLSLSSPRSALD